MAQDRDYVFHRIRDEVSGEESQTLSTLASPSGSVLLASVDHADKEVSSTCAREKNIFDPRNHCKGRRGKWLS
jgi:hypothetical protein